MSRVLVVDDNPDSIRIVESILKGTDYEVVAATNGPAALEAVATKPPSVILLDVMMPGMSGLEVLEKLRAEPKNGRIPIILLTAKTQDEDVISGYRTGADYYIPKPFTSKQLLYGIRLVLGEPVPA
ncbi:MAG: response regulator transcription factor [Candidatus Binatia bacterium]